MACFEALRGIAGPPNDPFINTTVLLRTVKAGACKQTTFLLEQGCDPNLSSGSRSIQPLMMACYIQDERKKLSIIRSLLLFGADPSLGDTYSRNAFMYACALGSRAVAEALLYGADFDLNAADDDLNTALHFAAITGNVYVITALLEQLRKLQLDNSPRNSQFLTPLSIALLNRNVECAEVLYEHRALPRFTANQFQNILLAISENKVEVANELIYRDMSDGVKVNTACHITDKEQFDALSRQNSRKQFLQRSLRRANCQPESRSSFVFVTRDMKSCRSRTVSAGVPTTRKNTAESLTKRDGGRIRSSTVKPPSSLDIYSELMRRYYPTQSSPLYCPPRSHVDTGWVDSLQHRCIPDCFQNPPLIPYGGNSVEGINRPLKLTRTSSTSSTPRIVPGGTRAKLTRMITSPMF